MELGVEVASRKGNRSGSPERAFRLRNEATVDADFNQRQR